MFCILSSYFYLLIGIVICLPTGVSQTQCDLKKCFPHNAILLFQRILAALQKDSGKVSRGKLSHIQKEMTLGLWEKESLVSSVSVGYSKKK